MAKREEVPGTNLTQEELVLYNECLKSIAADIAAAINEQGETHGNAQRC